MDRTWGVSPDAASREGEAGVRPLPGLRLSDEPEALRRRLAGVLVMPVERGVSVLQRKRSRLLLEWASPNTH